MCRVRTEIFSCMRCAMRMYIRAVLWHVRVHFLPGMRGCARARGSWMSDFLRVHTCARSEPLRCADRHADGCDTCKFLVCTAHVGVGLGHEKCDIHEPSARRHPRIAEPISVTCDFCHVPRQRMRTAFNFLLRTDAASAYMRYRIRVPNNLHLLTALLKACILKFARTTSL